MSQELRSRERVLLAYARREPDRVPIIFRTIEPLTHRWHNQVERAEFLLSWGADDLLTFALPLVTHRSAIRRVWREESRPYPILHQTWYTPQGTLHASVYMTEDWPSDDVPLYSDHAWSRGIDHWLKTEEDLRALGYLLRDPRESELEQIRAEYAALRREADRLEVVLQGSMYPAPLYAMGLLGGQRCITLVRDDPDLFAAVLADIQRWSRQNLSLLLELGVDVVYRSSCYETIDFYAPVDVRRFFMPLLRDDVRLCHEAGVPLHSFAQTGVMPFLEDYAAMGLDILSSLDTRGTNPMDLALVQQRLAGRCCLMGGVDNRDPFVSESAAQMERTVLDVLRILAPGGGYILSPAGMIFPEGKEENIRAFIEAGRRHGAYPLSFAQG